MKQRTSYSALVVIGCIKSLVVLLICLVQVSLALAIESPSDEMKAWANKHPVVKLAADDKLPPYDYIDESGQPQGVGRDLADALNNHLPFKLEFLPAADFATQFGSTVNGTADVFSLCAMTQKRKNKLLFTNPIFAKESVLVVNKDIGNIRSIDDVRPKHAIGYGAGYATESDAKAISGSPELVPVRSVREGLRQVTSGQLDGFVTDLGQASYWVSNNQVSAIGFVDLLNDRQMLMRYCVNKQHPMLVEWINWGLQQVGQQKIDEIHTKWASEDYQNMVDQNLGQRSNWGPVLIIVVVIFAVIAGIVFMTIFSSKKADLIAERFGSEKFRNSYIVGLIVLCLIILLLTQIVLTRFKNSTVDSYAQALDVSLVNTDSRLKDWFNDRSSVINHMADQEEVKQLSWVLAELEKAGYSQKGSSELRAFRKIIQPYVSLQGKADGYYLVNAQGKTLAAAVDRLVGEESLLMLQAPEYLERMLKGETVFVPPIWSDIDFDGNKAKHDTDPAVLIGTPVFDHEDNVVAAIVLSFNPNKDFSRIFRSSRIGKTGESYAVNTEGLMISKSRFNKDLIRKGALLAGESAILNIKVPEIIDKDSVYKGAIEQSSGEDLEFHLDYRGKRVISKWYWLSELGILLVSDVDIEEVYENYYQTRFSAWLVSSIALISVIVISIFMLVVGRKAYLIQEASRKELEGLVDERTKALVEQQQALAKSEQHNRMILGSVADGIIGIDFDKKCNFINQAALILLGTTVEKAVGMDINQLLAGEDQHLSSEEHPDPVNFALETGNSLSNQSSRFWHLGVNDFPVEFSINPLTVDHALSGAVIAFRDVTDRILFTERMSKLLESAPVAMLVVDRKGRIEDINKQTSDLFGYEQHEMIGQPVELITPKHLENHKQWVSEYMKNPRSLVLSDLEGLHGVKKNGDTFDAQVTINPIELHDGVVAVVGIRDVSQEVAARDALIDAKQLADEASKAKSNFLANMSHEIRTPMNAIIGMSHLALQQKLDRKAENYVHKVHNAATSLLGIINDILDFSKIEAGRLELESTEFDLDDVLDNVSTVISVKTQERGLDLLFHVEQDVPMGLIGDPLRLGQVLINLAGNSVKFTEQGEVAISVCKVTDDSLSEDQVRLKFSVRDTGIGMTQEQQSKLFASFSQADASTTRKYGGTGLGLSISKSLVQLMKGEIWLQSEAGVGSEFFFTTVMELGDDIAETVLPEADVELLNGKRVLIVDDSVAAVDVLKEIVTSFGCEVYTAVSGKQAIELAEGVDFSFDIALIDWQMPGLNGLEVCDALKALKNQSMKHFVMVSAYGKEEIGQHNLEGRVDSLMTKPVTQSTLFEELMRLMGRQVAVSKKRTRSAEQAARKSALKGAYVLLVEDNELNQELALELLKGAGLKADLAEDGKQAVDMMQRNQSAELHYDGVLMDIQMPVMDGYQATKAIREFNSVIPIIAMTANAMTGDKERVIAAGMNDHISKPINVADMFDTLSQWVKPSAPMVSDETLQGLDSEASSVPIHDAEELLATVSLQAIDTAAGLATCNDDAGLYLRLLNKFYNGQQSFVQEFTAALPNDDQLGGNGALDEIWEPATRSAHSLKGSGGNIGAKALYSSAAKLEQACKHGAEDSTLQPLLEQVINALNDVFTDIEMLQGLQGNSDIACEAQPSLSNEELAEKFKELTILIEEFDTDAQEIALDLASQVTGESLKKLFSQFAYQLENFDFDGAGQTLDKMKESIN